MTVYVQFKIKFIIASIEHDFKWKLNSIRDADNIAVRVLRINTLYYKFGSGLVSSSGGEHDGR